MSDIRALPGRRVSQPFLPAVGAPTPRGAGAPAFHLHHSLCRAGLRLLADAPALAAPSVFLPDGGSGSATSASSMSGGTVDLLLSPARQPRVSISLPETEARGPSLLSRRATLCLPLAFAAVPGGQQTSISPNRLWSAPESPPCGGSGLLSCPRTSSWQSVLLTFFRGRLSVSAIAVPGSRASFALIAQGRRLGGLVIRTELP